ncbi:phage regulatory CII family protein, partial [Salmonella enterica]
SGEFHQEIKDALEDGRIKPDEHQRIAKRGWSYIRAVMECVSRIEGMVDDK